MVRYFIRINNKEKIYITRKEEENNCKVFIRKRFNRIRLGEDWIDIINTKFVNTLTHDSDQKIQNIINFSDLHTSMYLCRDANTPKVKIYNVNGRPIFEGNISEKEFYLEKEGNILDSIDQSLGFSKSNNRLALGRVSF